MEIFKKYAQEMKEIFEAKNYNEYSFRTPLENLLNEIKPTGLKIIHEPKSEKGQELVRPDFKAYKLVDSEKELSYNHLIGFIECKNLDADLSLHLGGNQLNKYLQISPNIIFTNYKRFMLLSFDKVLYDVNLLDDELNIIEQDNLFDKNILQFKRLIQAFFDDNSTTIKSKQELVKVLSTQSFYLSNALKIAYEESDDENFSFQTFFERTKDTFINIEKIALEIEEFCDTVAQAIVYGIFVSYMENDDYDLGKIPVENFISFLPRTFRTLSEFVYFSVPSFSLPKDVIYTLDNVKKTLALIDKIALCEILNQELEIISVYLYEDFLKAYDDLKATQKRKEGGVFYTPKSIVEMIVSSLDELLKVKFDKTGFNDKSVKVLDFATGTGSFLASVFEKIISKEKEVFKNETIKNKFLQDIYGFELSFVPYIVARLKLGQILRKHGFTDFNDADFKIYLNNTLDLEQYANFDMSMPLLNLDKEWKKARDVKYIKNLLVVLGNPPYSVKSKNKDKKISELLETYKKGLNETKINLDDDYIKFMRFAQWKLLEQEKSQLFENNVGLMGFITNNSFLDGRTHRKMRESLFKSFDEIYILNLHGNNEKDAKEDENVFDIRVGVCISLFVKHKSEPSKGAKIFYASTAQEGIFKRKEKFALLDRITKEGLLKSVRSLKFIKWQKLSLKAPYFWFVPKSFENTEYENFWALASDKALGHKKAVFLHCGIGNMFGRDKICIHLNEKSLKQTKQDFKALSVEKLKNKYTLQDSRDWSVERAKEDILENYENLQDKIIKITYRPFDERWSFFTGKSKGFWGTPSSLNKHVLAKENLGLCLSKYCQKFFDTPLISEGITDMHYNGSGCYIAPIYLYEKQENKEIKIPNFTDEFLSYKKKHQILKDKSPEAILSFIYANLYHPKYRKKYLEYLKIGFARVNFEVSEKEFKRLENLGNKLIKLHLMQEIPKDNMDFIFLKENKKANFLIKKYPEKERFIENKIILNEDLAISPVSPEIWDYTIGGYQVIKQWLKYRSDYECSKEELEHLLKMCKVIKETINLQKELDAI